VAAGSRGRNPRRTGAAGSTLIAADVLEHLVDPWTTLQQAVTWLVDGATVVISLPNVRTGVRCGGLFGSSPGHGTMKASSTTATFGGSACGTPRTSLLALDSACIDPQYWESGNALTRTKRLARTPLAPYLPVQLVVVAEKRRSRWRADFEAESATLSRHKTGDDL
jgi:hypothetical protein